MFAVLSPAKKLTDCQRGLPVTEPVMLTDTSLLLDRLRGLSRKQLSSLMGISDKLTELNHGRYQAFKTTTPASATPAALTFAGDTYQGFDAPNLSDTELSFSQNHIGILSGLYGLLRPLDMIQPYRLEMGSGLATKRGKTLYDFWGTRITAHINRITEAHSDRTLVNLASKEYFSSLQPVDLAGQVITPIFKDVRKGKAKVISFLAKRARGAMARYIVKEALDSPEGMKDFTSAGYSYQPNLSTDHDWVFLRPE
jgi:hypothetical protein